MPRVEPPVGTLGRPLRFLAVCPRLGASQLKKEEELVKVRTVEGMLDGYVGRPIVF